MKQIYILTLILSGLVNTPFASAKFKCDPKIDLKKMSENIQDYMDKAPVKYDKDCKPIKSSYSFLFQNFTEQELNLYKFVDAKDALRSKFSMSTQDGTQIDLGQRGRAGEQGNDKHYNLVDYLSITNQGVVNINEMQNLNLLSATLPTDSRPWSDDYWALARGILSYRYSDRAMTNEAEEIYSKNPDKIWKGLYDFFYTQENSSTNYVERKIITRLSPAEKYDLLVGDSSYSFSRWMWDQGKSYYEQNGKVETWMGICHGWAPASYMLPRATKSIVVRSAQGGHDIIFRPADIKGLATQLWASSKLVDKSGRLVRTKFIGGRCNNKDPEKDSNGRIIDQDCFDNNPSSWHKAVVNQIGIAKRSTVMDATYDYEVWNHPIISYTYEYFNPKTMLRFKTIEEAITTKDSFKNDKFKKYRNSATKKVIGIIMEVTYSVETRPTDRDHDNAYYDASNTAHYTYDLELDDDNNIIGGEWYSNKHPDFLWTPPVDAVSRADYEINFPQKFTGTWDVKNESVPEQWSFFAKPIINNGQVYQGASEQGQPIGVIIEALIKASNEESN